MAIIGAGVGVVHMDVAAWRRYASHAHSFAGIEVALVEPHRRPRRCVPVEPARKTNRNWVECTDMDDSYEGV